MGTATPGQFKKVKFSAVTLPSGNEVRLKRVSLEEWLATGQVPNALKPVLAMALEGKTPTNMDILGSETAEGVSPEKLGELLEMYDYAAVKCMVEPRCLPAPKNEADRDDELLYADEVGVEDKAFIFYWSTGGSSDIARFRQGSAEALGPVAQVEDVEAATERADGDPERS